MAKGFEESLNELENIVEQLDRGDVSLDESVKLFENGMKLAKSLRRLLDNAEKKVSVLLADENGELKKVDFDADNA